MMYLTKSNSINRNYRRVILLSGERGMNKIVRNKLRSKLDRKICAVKKTISKIQRKKYKF